MKISYIQHIILLSLLIVICACSGDDSDNGIEIKVPTAGYIHFGTESKTTRASNIVEDMTGKDFDVIAFQYSYSSDWNTFKATGTPASSKFPFPTHVTHSTNSLWTYDASSTNNGQALVEWDNASKYAFFAYYPQSGTGSCIQTATTRNTAGTPAITYTVPSSTDPSALKDVMIASMMDVTNNSDGTVYFFFRHCLSCITIEARNLDEVENSDDHSKDQTISDLKLYITSDLWGSLTIPLDYTIEQTPGNKTSTTKEYSIFGSSTTVNVPALVKGNSLQTVPVSGDNNIFIIPQTAAKNGHLKGYLSFTDKNAEKKIGKENVTGYTYDSNLVFDANRDFEAGHKYSLIINFANGQISIAIIDTNDWTDVNQTITFE